jgi:hypothetical protein
MTTGEQHADYPKEVIEAIGEHMPEKSWVVTQPDRLGAGTPFYSISNALRRNTDVINILLNGEEHARLGIVDPNTMAVGLWLRGQRQITPEKLGLFSLRAQDKYDPSHVLEVLGGNALEHQVGHGSVNLVSATGRGAGTISPILDRVHLQGFTTIDFSAQLLDEITQPSTAVAYPIGGKGYKYYVANGQYFVPAFARFLAEENVPTNLSTF